MSSPTRINLSPLNNQHLSVHWRQPYGIVSSEQYQLVICMDCEGCSLAASSKTDLKAGSVSEYPILLSKKNWWFAATWWPAQLKAWQINMEMCSMKFENDWRVSRSADQPTKLLSPISASPSCLEAPCSNSDYIVLLVRWPSLKFFHSFPSNPGQRFSSPIFISPQQG